MVSWLKNHPRVTRNTNESATSPRARSSYSKQAEVINFGSSITIVTLKFHLTPNYFGTGDTIQKRVNIILIILKVQQSLSYQTSKLFLSFEASLTHSYIDSNWHLSIATC